MVDREKVERAVRLLLEGIGEDVTREGLVETPARIARMYEEICGGMEEDAKEHLQKTFTVDNNEMVLEKDITFYSMCEHHMLPFYGKVHVAYIPDGKVAGKNGRSVCEAAAASGADDSADRGCADGALVSERCDSYGRSRTSVYDYARCEKAGNNDGERCGKRRV